MQNLDIISNSFKKSNNYLFDYYKKINRKLKFSSHELIINEIIDKAIFENNPTKIIDLFILTFLSRDCRYGKGEKISFYRIINILYSKFPETTTSLIECIPYYGYWKDLFLIINEIKDNPINDINYLDLENKIYQIYSLQLLEDYAKHKNNLNDISLAAKFAPREGKHYDKEYNTVSRIIKILYPEIVGPHNKGLSTHQIKNNWNKAKRLYSNMITTLSNVLDVTEIKLCQNNINKIIIENVPSKCLYKNYKKISSIYSLKNKIKTVTFPHKIINDLLQKKKSYKSQILHFTEWQNLIENIQKQNNNFFIDKIPIFCNASSIDDISYEISFSLALLISNLDEQMHTNRIISIESITINPIINEYFKYYKSILSYDKNILKKIKKLKLKIKNSAFNKEINIYRLYEDYIDKYMDSYSYPFNSTAKKNQKNPQDIIIFTSDDYNTLISKNKISFMTVKELDETRYRIKKLFNHKTIPNIIFWNISSDIDLFPKETEQEYILEMSGKSSEFLENLLGINFDEQFDNNNFNDLSLEQFENKIADSRYDSIRAKLVLSNEGILSNFANSNPNDAMLFE